jgi:hypothetical protein
MLTRPSVRRVSRGNNFIMGQGSVNFECPKATLEKSMSFWNSFWSIPPVVIDTSWPLRIYTILNKGVQVCVKEVVGRFGTEWSHIRPALQA